MKRCTNEQSHKTSWITITYYCNLRVGSHSAARSAQGCELNISGSQKDTRGSKLESRMNDYMKYLGVDQWLLTFLIRFSPFSNLPA